MSELRGPTQLLQISPERSTETHKQRPVVALESTIISRGIPFLNAQTW